MKNITFSAQEEAIEQARKVAAQRNRTLNELFREWLNDLNNKNIKVDGAKRLTALWKKTSYVRIGKKLSHDEMNER